MNKFVLIIGFIFFSIELLGQISAPSANYVGNLNDLDETLYVFYTTEGVNSASLTAQTPLGDVSSFRWERLNLTSGDFEFYADGGTGPESVINNLENGAYRVVIGSDPALEEVWVLNEWFMIIPQIVRSTCDDLTFDSEVNFATFEYINNSRQKKTLIRIPQVEWFNQEGIRLSTKLSFTTTPPWLNTVFKLRIRDQFDMSQQASIDYTSIVPHADFSVDEAEGDAPLEVEFTNNSINADSYTWSFYKSDQDIAFEITAGNPVDSVESVSSPITDAPFSKVYEKTGDYTVRLNVTKGECKDSVYFHPISVNPSEIDVPWAFSPNADNEANRTFYVKAKSMRSLEITIFNRWGRNIHHWNSNRISASDQVEKESVWDGKIGGTLASPGVYYYVLKAVGADDKRYNKKGFFHLFRRK